MRWEASASDSPAGVQQLRPRTEALDDSRWASDTPKTGKGWASGGGCTLDTVKRVPSRRSIRRYCHHSSRSVPLARALGSPREPAPAAATRERKNSAIS